MTLPQKLGFWKRFAAAALATIAALATSTSHAGVTPPPQGTWQTTLQPLDLDHDTEPDAFYDTVLNITWLRNANANMDMVWADAQSWASKLVLGGVGGWRLPTMVDTGEPGCDIGAPGQSDCGFNPSLAGNEMAHLYYVTLGQQRQPQPSRGRPVSEPGGLAAIGPASRLPTATLTRRSCSTPQLVSS